MLSIMPMLSILFKQTKAIPEKPEWSGIGNIKEYFEQTLNFWITEIEKTGTDNVLFFMIIMILSTFLLKNLFNYLALFFITFLRNGLLKKLRDDLYQKIIHLPIGYFSQKKRGDILSRITNDINEVQGSFLSLLELLIREPLTIIFTLIAMLLLSWELTLFVFIFIPISGLIISMIGKKLKSESLKVQKEQGLFLSILEETLVGLKIIKSFNSEYFFMKKFKLSTLRFLSYSNKLMNRQNLASPISEFLGVTVITVLLWYGSKMVIIDNSIEASTFLVFISLAYNILTPAKAISKANYSIKKGDAAAERVLEIIELKTNNDNKGSEEISEIKNNIIFNNVSFKYQDSSILKKLSFEIKKGEKVALVGQSGSGKTTIANLLMRFYNVNKGNITIDGININHIKKEII